MPIISGQYFKALVVADGIVHFGPKDSTDATFTLSSFIDALQSNKVPEISVTTAHRRADSNADFENFNFAQGNLSDYDEIWLFGYEGSNEGFVANGTSAIGQDELAAIASFMQKGGGVFATGDHAGLGSFLCGQIPRVRSMRKWYDGKGVVPPGYPANWSGSGPDRADTTRPDHNGQFFFDNQSDDIPQPLSLSGGTVNAHPILQGPNGAITQFPDHMHEGEVITPWTLGDTLTFAGQSFVEYPIVGGQQEVPHIIATGTVLGGHQTPLEGNDSQQFVGDSDDTNPKQINILCAYDGRNANVGRVVTDSSFHHLIDLNLTGDPLGVGNKQKGFTTVAGEATLADLQAYYVNTAVWLAKSLHYWWFVDIVLALPWWWELFDPGGPVESDPSKVLQYGALMRQELARYVRDALTVDWIRGALRAEGLGHLVAAREGSAPRQADAAAHYRGDIIAAVLGGATLAMMRARRDPANRLDRREAEAAAHSGMLAGLHALGGLVRRYSEQSEALAASLLRAGDQAHR
jgi:hypothetical protein